MDQLDDFQFIGLTEEKEVEKIKKRSGIYYLKRKPICSMLLLFFLLLGFLFADAFCKYDPSAFYLEHLNESPNWDFYFGTDSLGRDIFSMIWYGGRISFFVGCVSMVISTMIGIVYGCISAMSKPLVDSFMMRLAELWSSVPNLLILILLSSILGKQNIWKISFAIGVSNWIAIARMVRAEVKQIRMKEYILVSKRMGAGFFFLMHRHLFSNFMPTILFMVVSTIGTAISLESTLSFLGLGLPVTVMSWGSIMSLANKALLLNTWWVIVIPGIFLTVSLVCITNIASSFKKDIYQNHNNL